MKQYDVIVIGAGVIGCAIASELKEKRVLVLERNKSVAEETSRFNSGVIHSGIHLNPTYLKARLVVEGKRLLLEHCELFGSIPFRQVGMNIVVARGDVAHLWGEIHNLLNMLKRARRLGVTCNLISGRKLNNNEPSVRALFALHIPENCIIDPVAFTKSLACHAQNNGVDFRFTENVTTIQAEAHSVVVTTDQSQYRTRLIINAAGLAADKVAKLAGYDYSQVFYRGEYYQILPNSGIKVSSLVYPVHRPGKPGLGVHITPTVDGRVLLGPNATAISRRDDYDTNKTPAQAFFDDVRAFLPKLKVEDLEWAYSGIRPKLATGKNENDFSVNFDNDSIPMINLIGIESPGLTASMSLAKLVRVEAGKRYY